MSGIWRIWASILRDFSEFITRMHVSNCSWWRWVMFLFPLPLVAICKMLSPTMTKWSLSTSSLLVWISSCTFAFKNHIMSFSWDPNWCFKGICRWHLLLLRLVITVQGKKKDYLQSFSWWIYEMLIYYVFCHLKIYFAIYFHLSQYPWLHERRAYFSLVKRGNAK